MTVIGGPFAAKAYANELSGFAGKPVAVRGIGARAARARVDADGAAATAELISLKGSTYCAVVPQTDAIPGVAKLEEAAGDTADIGNAAYAEIAAAVGTLCNRIYGTGNTNPDLSQLTAAAAAVTTTTSDGIPGA